MSVIKTIAGGYQPACGACGICLCYELSEQEYTERQDYWDEWECKECNPNYLRNYQRRNHSFDRFYAGLALE